MVVVVLYGKGPRACNQKTVPILLGIIEVLILPPSSVFFLTLFHIHKLP